MWSEDLDVRHPPCGVDTCGAEARGVRLVVSSSDDVDAASPRPRLPTWW